MSATGPPIGMVTVAEGAAMGLDEVVAYAQGVKEAALPDIHAETT